MTRATQKRSFWVSFFIFSVYLSLSFVAAPLVMGQESPYKIKVYGGDEASFTPNSDAPVQDLNKKYDVIVVGGGLAGLMSAVYLTDKNKSVLLLEKEADLGGLAAGTRSGVRYDRGAAYWTDAYKEEQKLLNRIGLQDYVKKYEIPEPIDSYYWKGHLYKGVWDTETLKELPASFLLFKFELERASVDKLIPDQPFENFSKVGGSMELDQYTASEWLNQLPGRLDKHIEKWQAQQKESIEQHKTNSNFFRTTKTLLVQAIEIKNRFKKEKDLGLLAGKEGMDDLIDFLNLYCRSALGAPSQFVSAMAFANFYISEIVPRFTTQTGTALAATNMEHILRTREKERIERRINNRKQVELQTLSPVKKITQTDQDVEVIYQKGNENFRVKASYVVFAAQLKLAPLMVEGLKEKSPEQANLMATLGYSHYSVHVIKVEGHPYRASYDTWVRARDYTDDDFTDLILGLWMHPSIEGYGMYRDFKKNPPIKNGIFTIYHPLSQKWLNTGYTDEDARLIAKTAIDRVEALFSQLPADSWQGPMKVVSAETNRWPFSVHIAVPGHYSHKAEILRKPFGRVVFGNNNLGTPAFEEALFRGHCAANNVLKKMNSAFVNETWSRCPLD